MTDSAGTQVLKAQAIIAYAQALPGVWEEAHADRDAYLDEAIAVVQSAMRARPEDADLDEIASLLETYAARF